MANFDQQNQSVDQQFNAEIINYFNINIEQIKNLGVAESAVRNFFGILSQKQIPMDEWDNELRKIANNYLEINKKLSSFETDDSKIETLILEAQHALSNFNFDVAESLLKEAINSENDAADRIKTEFQKRKRSACKAELILADTLHLRFDFNAARCHYSNALKHAMDSNDPESTAICYGKIAFTLTKVGEYREALNYHDKSLELLGEDYKYIGTTYMDKGVCFQSLGEYTHAIEAHDFALKKHIKHFGPSSLEVARVYSCLGLVYSAEGNKLKAIEYHEKAIAEAKNICSETDPDFIALKNNLACAYEYDRRYAEALNIFNEVLENALALEVPNKILLAIYYENIGTIYPHIGQFEKGLELLDKALEINNSILGQGNAKSIAIGRKKSHILFTLGEVNSAISLVKESLKIANERYGESHFEIAFCNAMLGRYKAKIGEYSEAKALLSCALSELKRIYGSEHNHYVTCLMETSELYLEMGDVLVAEEHLYEALRINNALSGGNNSIAANIYNNFGLVFFLKGDYKKSTDNFIESLSIHNKNKESSLHNTALIKLNFGMILAQTEQLDLALHYLSQAQVEFALQTPPPPEQIVKLQSFFCFIRTLKGDYEDARKNGKEAVDLGRSLTSINSVLPIALKHLAFLESQSGNFDLALTYLTEAISLFKSLNRSSIDYAYCLCDVGVIYIKQGEFERAVDELKKAVDIMDALAIENHSSKGMAYNNIAQAFLALNKTDSALIYLNKSIAAYETNPSIFYDTISTLFLHIGSVHFRKNEFGYASNIFLKVINREKSAHGLHHTRTASAHWHYANALNHNREFKPALESLLALSGIQSELLENKSEFTGDVYLEISRAMNRINNGYTNISITYLEMAALIFKSCLGTYHTKTIQSENELKSIQNQQSVINSTIILKTID